MIVLGLVHPMPDDDLYREVHDHLALWIGIHLLLPFLVLASSSPSPGCRGP
jgi:aromatic ring-cleaving dioxygenase